MNSIKSFLNFLVLIVKQEDSKVMKALIIIFYLDMFLALPILGCAIVTMRFLGMEA